MKRKATADTTQSKRRKLLHEDNATTATDDSFDTSYAFSMDQLDAFKQHLQDKGYAVLKNVISREKANEYKQDLLNFICTLHREGKLDPEDTETWKHGNWPFALHGIIKNYGIGHSEASWRARVEPHVLRAFLHLHGLKEDTELTVSMDGACVLRPHGKAHENIHTDQSPQMIQKMGAEFRCYQSFLNLIDCGPLDGGFVAYESSHWKHAEYFEKHGLSDLKSNWFIFHSTDQKKKTGPGGYEFLQQFKRVKVVCQAGDMVFWDSRTAHTVTPSQSDHLRAVLYLCYMPRKYLTTKDVEKKRRALREYITTSHWPCIDVSLNGKMPRWSSGIQGFFHPNDPDDAWHGVDAWNWFCRPKLTAQMKRLAGLPEAECVDDE